jgi:hypothetical protein
MKVCSICKELRPYDATQERRSKASGFFGAKCWTCYLEHKKPGNLLASKRWYEKNATPEFLAAEVQRHLAWQKENPAKANAGTYKYRAKKYSATPPWADEDAILAYYEAAQAFGLEVDHVIPLNGALVSGLHVHTNLQLLTRAENASKGNRIGNGK